MTLVTLATLNNNHAVKFRSYNIINKNRADGHGGGVAILINKSMPKTPLNIINTETIESIGFSIKSPDEVYDFG